jgi:hypothetical protein
MALREEVEGQDLGRTKLSGKGDEREREGRNLKGGTRLKRLDRAIELETRIGFSWCHSDHLPHPLKQLPSVHP